MAARRASPAPRTAPIQVARGVTLAPPPAAAGTSGSAPAAGGSGGHSITREPASTSSTTVATTAGRSTSYAFLGEWAPGKPIRWNPCAPLHYAVNAAAAPPGTLGTVQQAMALVSSATGMSVVFDGTTNEIPTSRWGHGPSASFPSGWQPLLIGVVRDAESDLLSGGDVGTGIPVTIQFTDSGESVNVSGAVAIDADQMQGLPTGFGGASVGSAVLHEVGHALGLAHVEDRAQIMNPGIGPWTPNQWGPGDREGLRRIGTEAGCTRTAPPAPWG